MRVIGVVDLRGGLAVRAYAGHRDRYQPIGDAVDLARRYVEHYRLGELYVADLDAIEGEQKKPAQHAIRRIADLGVPLWLDAGVSTVGGARRALELGATHVVVGLETLPSFDTLEAICRTTGKRVAFSLDLRGGEPIAGPGIPRETPERLAARAADAGVGSLIVIDLARVGMRDGLDFALLTRVGQAARGLTFLAGGGVRGVEDLARLADAGCDGALVATALDDLYASATR